MRMANEATQSPTQPFNFSHDLRELEKLYQEQHQVQLEQQKTKSASGEASPTSKDGQFLEQLSERIAMRLRQNLSQPDVLKQYLDVEVLQQDNTVMAQHIQTLVQRVEQLEAQNQLLLQHQIAFRQIWGNLYLRNA